MKLSIGEVVSDRSQVKDLSVSVQELAELFDHAPDLAFFVKDATGRYLVVNESLVKRHGYCQKSQILGRRPCDICPGDFGRLPTEQDVAVLRTGKPLLDHLEQQWYLPQRPVWCLTTKFPLRNRAGKIIGVLGISRDVRSPMDPRSIPAELARALEAFENDLVETVTPSTLARRAKLTLAQLSRHLRRIFTLTPTQFITQTRLNASARRLRETDLSISEIALECGFYDHSAFSRAFHEAMGVTPSAYRQAIRKAPAPPC